MNFELTEPQLDFQKGILQFAKKEFDHSSKEEEGDGLFPVEGWRKCAQMGLMGLLVSEKIWWNE